MDGSTFPIARLTLPEAAAERLRALIIEGELAPGAKLNERELSERLGVSRTPLREAFRMLAADGLLIQLPNRGAQVVMRAFVRKIPRCSEPGGFGTEPDVPFVAMDDDPASGPGAAQLADRPDADLPEQTQPDQQDVAARTPQRGHELRRVRRLGGHDKVRVVVQRGFHAEAQ